MPKNNHSRILEQERTRLDEERTRLANERTSLAYLRTALSFIVAGIILAKFYTDKMIETISIIVISVGVVLMLVGIYAFPVRNRRIKSIMHKMNLYRLFKEQ